MAFKLTYATMFNPPEELHQGFDNAVTKLKSNLGKEYSMIIDGKDVFADEKWEDRSPVNTDWVLARMQKGNAAMPRQPSRPLARHSRSEPYTLAGTRPNRSKGGFPAGGRIYELSVAMALEVGKNRMESLGDVQETADLMYFSALTTEKNNGFIKPMGKDPLVGYDATNISILRPYGVWLDRQPIQLSLCTHRWTDWRGTCCGEYRCYQTRHRYSLDRSPLRGSTPGCRFPGRCRKLR